MFLLNKTVICLCLHSLSEVYWHDLCISDTYLFGYFSQTRTFLNLMKELKKYDFVRLTRQHRLNLVTFLLIKLLRICKGWWDASITLYNCLFPYKGYTIRVIDIASESGLGKTSSNPYLTSCVPFSANARAKSLNSSLLLTKS